MKKAAYFAAFFSIISKSGVSMKKSFCIVLAVVLTAAVVFGATFGVMYARNKALEAKVEELSATNGENRKLSELRGLIDQVYIGEIDEDYMTECLCAAMVEGIDDEWSYYISAEDYAAFVENQTNSYVGIGITIRLIEETDPGFTIIEISPDSPAEKAGLKPGDILIGVGGQSAIEIGMDETKNLVRGEAGTDVTVKFLIDGEEKDITMKRASVKSVNVTYELLEDQIGYVHIKNFEQDCAKDSIAAIEDLRLQGAQSLIFDVRFNPGGMKNELVMLLDYLLPEGVIFRSERYDGTSDTDTSDANYLDMPMCVLVNVDSYSAAEFFAAALQEYGAATIVGTQTYGKGYFQQCLRLSDGSAVNISTGKYFTPNGVSLAGVGITPDKVVEISDDDYLAVYLGSIEHKDDIQLQTAIDVLK